MLRSLYRFILILSSSAINKKNLEIYTKLENELEIEKKNLGNELKIKKNSNNLSLFSRFFVNYEFIFEFFVNGRWSHYYVKLSKYCTKNGISKEWKQANRFLWMIFFWVADCIHGALFSVVHSLKWKGQGPLGSYWEAV